MASKSSKLLKKKLAATRRGLKIVGSDLKSGFKKRARLTQEEKSQLMSLKKKVKKKFNRQKLESYGANVDFRRLLG